jgi:4-diphosphocytidyl-2-C-methyl-D-erythritol kinase
MPLHAVSDSLAARAPAKVNLTLHIVGRREDGLHELESLVAFAGTGDIVSLTPAPALALAIDGPTAPLAGSADDNLILKAARLLADRIEGLRLGAFHLRKRLPVAAGLGGGSADAAAALRLLAQLNGLPLDNAAVRDAARLTGADVPVCLEPRARMMGGAGEQLGPPIQLPRLFAVLANPGRALETSAVFAALGVSRGERLEGPKHPAVVSGAAISATLDALRQGRNDLEPAARSLQPAIDEVLRELASLSGCRLARMSGSGATVFGLFDDCAASADAAKAVKRAYPHWWVKATSLR